MQPSLWNKVDTAEWDMSTLKPSGILLVSATIAGTGTSITSSPSGDITNIVGEDVAAFLEASGEMNIEEFSSCGISEVGPEVITVYRADFQLELPLSPHQFSPHVVLSNTAPAERMKHMLVPTKRHLANYARADRTGISGAWVAPQ